MFTYFWKNYDLNQLLSVKTFFSRSAGDFFVPDCVSDPSKPFRVIKSVAERDFQNVFCRQDIIVQENIVLANW